MERKIIGSLITDIGFMKQCLTLTPEMFTTEIAADIYKVMLQRYQLGLPISVVDITESLSDKHPKQTTNAYIKDCVMESCYTSNEVKSAVNVLKNEFKALKLKELVNSQSYISKGINETIRTLNKATEEMLKEEKPKGKSLNDIADRFKDYYGQEHEQGIRTGLYELDEILNGLNKGDVTVLGARPAVGKSALVTQILCDVAAKGKRVGYFNLEMTDQQILERVIARYSGIPLLRLRKAICFMEEEKKAYIKALDKIQSTKGLYIFSGSYTANEMKVLCKNQDFDLVVIDYLQLVKADKSYGNRVAEVGDISKSIKSLAMENEVPVIALSQLNRRKSATDEPEIADLRESGDIEQDASSVLLMWNISDDGKVKGLKVDKNRQGELGHIALEYEGSKMSFRVINHKPFETIVKEYKNVRSVKADDECPFT